MAIAFQSDKNQLQFLATKKKFFSIFFLIFFLIAPHFTLYAQLTELASNNSLKGIVTNDGRKCLLTNFENKLWTTDGTTVGTKKFTDKVITAFDPFLCIDYKGEVLFSGYSENEGLALWKTDGTDIGTQMIKRFSTGIDLNFQANFISFKDKIFFFAKTDEAGYELWVTDGTGPGTNMVKDINPGPDGSYVFDGSENFPFFPSDSALTSITKDLLYFQANDGIHGQELWKTDGTEAGTKLVKDINPGVDGSFPGGRFTIGDNIIFWAKDLQHGFEIWKTDGTDVGTQLVKDLIPGQASNSADGLFKFKNKLYFQFNTPENGAELWCTDGTESGTGLFKDFIPGPADSNPRAFAATIFADKFILPVTIHPDVNVEKLEYWVSDGTPAGTNKLFGNFKTIRPFQDYYDKNSDKSFLNQHAPFNGRVFFYGENSQTEALYLTDGATLQVVKTLSDLDYNYFYTPLGLHFIRPGADANFEYWKSDGTSAGTTSYGDLPRSPNGNTGYDFWYQNNLYFHNDNGDNPDNQRTDFLVEGSVLMTTVQWVGNISIDWSNGNNWSGGNIPGVNDAVVIPANTTFSPTIAAGVTLSVKSLSLEPGAKLTVSPTANLKVLQ